MMQGVVGSSCEGCGLLSLALLLCGTEREPQRQSMVEGRQSLSNKLSTRIHNLLVSTPLIAPIGETIVEVKFTLQLQG